MVGPAAQALEEDGQLWAGVNASVGLSDVLRAGLLVQTRQRDDMSELERVLLRPSLTARLGEKLSVGVGYDAHLIRNPRHLEEYRAWQQGLIGTPFASVDLDHRLRLEQRWGDTIDGTSVRLRYLLALASPELVAGLRGVLRNEIFLNLDHRDPTDRTGLGENRSFVGLRRAFGEQYTAEIGYQAQLLRPKHLENRLNHTLVVGVAARY